MAMDADVALLEALHPVAESLLERHLGNAKEWFPHELVPWSEGRDFEPGEVWDESQAPMDEAVRSALFVNLLTEDNLPHYFRTIDRLYGEDDAWGAWSKRWTAEEGRHAIVIRDYLTVTRAVDPVALERGRMSQLSGGQVPQPATVADGLVYVTLQEMATRISHRNTGRLLADKRGYEIMARVAGDEQLHHIFYRDTASALLEIDPSMVVLAIERNVKGFEMPGTGIPDFSKHAKAIADAGIYDFAAHHDHILQPIVVKHWGLEQLEGLSPEAEEARSSTLEFIRRVGKAGARMAERRAVRAAKAAERDPVPVSA
ncbi:MAG: Probable acyl-ACP desaturase, Stearoyl-ACP desaturase [uncultured Acidimicrobiales bacterium]|uniref:Probable acyl-ACP desaturase, Stearoyl-ACP desaturase n=1 Tax=uncultured Acidimicrobiales bacterium TaxID=310071 RepID=A0A6J4HXR8_9ACTN|nr:MAG: Probable acyl-ACP desaturase, Stearoyl-ACP desaturase [uncultured Acidimicrobiales bacterium]